MLEVLVALYGDINSGVSKHLPGSLFSFRFDDQPTFLGIGEVTQRKATLG